MKVELYTDDIVEAFCKMLAPGVNKNALNVPVNRYGVDVLTNKHDPSQLMFHFVTLEDLEIEICMDLMELESRGKEYMDHLYGLMCDQVEQARKVRHEDESLVLNTKLKPTVEAMN